ncbi:hypothetical protein [Microvirga calopogonii]|uniref:hypothetical protein n=1 Tax=Microvirga calopogonii TaxID=2078013 RepID=UPI0013B3CAD1|nr:hypothetical protein [Microvirga calopogonii]
MSETLSMKIVVGDQVRVHFHPPGSWKSFSEGVVRRIDVTTQEGRFFVVEVMHEVLLDREHPIRRGFPDYVRYECWNDFPGRIEVLSAAPVREQEPTPDLTLTDPRDELKQDASEPPLVDAQANSGAAVEQIPEAETGAEPTQVEIEHQSAPALGSLIASLFGRKA